MKMNLNKIVAQTLIVALIIILAGCSSKPRQGAPAPVISKSGFASQPDQYQDQDSGVKISALTPPAQPVAKPAANRAVQLLQERAQQQMTNNDLVSAAKTLERAVSIDPKDAKSWNLLAHLRARQKQYTMAVNIAAKSNSLAMEHQKMLKKDNFLLMAEMKSLLGSQTEAMQYRQQANSIN